MALPKFACKMTCAHATWLYSTLTKHSCPSGPLSIIKAPLWSPARRGTEIVFIASLWRIDTPSAAGMPPKTRAFVSYKLRAE